MRSATVFFSRRAGAVPALAAHRPATRARRCVRALAGEPARGLPPGRTTRPVAARDPGSTPRRRRIRSRPAPRPYDEPSPAFLH
jgi:hypothetical protein